MIIYPHLSFILLRINSCCGFCLVFKKNTSRSELFWDGALQTHLEPSVVSFFAALVTR